MKECNKLCKKSESTCEHCKKTYIVSDEFYKAKRASSSEIVTGYLVSYKKSGNISGILTCASDYNELAYIDETTLVVTSINSNRYKMKDKDVIKSLNCCTNDKLSCSRCPIREECLSHPIEPVLARYALEIINKQKGEISRLTYQVNHLKKYDEERDILLHSRLIATTRKETVEEFAEKLKAKAFTRENGFEANEDRFHAFVSIGEIDNLVKEMMEGNNGIL